MNGWSIDRELAAATVEQIAEGNRLFVVANTDPKKAGRPPQPLRIPRPGDLEPHTTRIASRDEMAAFFTRRG